VEHLTRRGAQQNVPKRRSKRKYLPSSALYSRSPVIVSAPSSSSTETLSTKPRKIEIGGGTGHKTIEGAVQKK
jgi:hypothetical protein